MSLKFRPIVRKLLAGVHAGQKRFFGQVRCGECIRFDKICKQVALLSTATKGDVELILDNFVEIINEQLENGNIIQLGDFGNFRIAGGSRAVEPGEKFHVSAIRRPRIVFSPGKELRRVTEKIVFEKLDTRVVTECPHPHL
ncbi:MAG: HU family DNA-binding protein [Bacteroides sp.]|nr:HU family DNA-binding protein [Bacteroides sp.]